MKGLDLRAAIGRYPTLQLAVNGAVASCRRCRGALMNKDEGDYTRALETRNGDLLVLAHVLLDALGEGGAL